MLEFSVGTDAGAQQQAQWLIYVDDDSYVLHDRLLGLLSRYDPSAPHYFGRPLQEDKLNLTLTPTRSLTLTRTLTNPHPHPHPHPRPRPRPRPHPHPTPHLHPHPNPSPNPNQEEGCPAFVGGGAGIVLSQAAALQIVARVRNGSAACDPYHRKWASRRHQGGDAWLGDCAEAG